MTLKGNHTHIILKTMLFQSLLLIVVSFTIIGASSLSSLKQIVPLLNVLIFLTTIFIFISLKKANSYIKKEAELDLIKSNMKNTEELLNLLNSQRHDCLRHIQAIGALLYLKEYDELDEYIEGISKEYRSTSEIIRLGHPTLTALINTKKRIVEEKGILFHIKCKHKVSVLKISSWELSSLISNLLENAIEAAMASEGDRWIKFTVDYYEGNYIFEIENTGQIKENIWENIFKPGISSKNSAERGYGLFIVKTIVERYGGTIHFENTKQNSVKFMITLPGEDIAYDKKAVS